MTVFLFVDDRLVDLANPLSMVSDRYADAFEGRNAAPFVLSEVCALDMLYAVKSVRDGYYGERLCLKGGLSVRSMMPLMGHRFSFDADFDPNTQAGATFGDVDGLRADLVRHASARGCTTRVSVTRDNARLHFIEVGYWDSLRRAGARIVERPKIEICKTCRVHRATAESEISTMVDLGALGLEPLRITHLSPEEQLATKLFVIGSSGRQRNHFDAYDAVAIAASCAPDMAGVRRVFRELCRRHGSDPGGYAEGCRRQLDAMARNAKKGREIRETAFGDPPSLAAVAGRAAALYGPARG